MTTAVSTDDAPGRSDCWCCGAVGDPNRMVQLGNHPEVGLCLRCAHWLSRRAMEVEDRDRPGVAVRLRHQARRVRGTVIRHGWHRNKITGPPLRWLGRHLG